MNNIYDTIKEGVRLLAPDKIALDDGRITLTYRELVRHVDDLAKSLSKHGVGRAGRVALYCRDGTGYVVASLAVLSLRAVVVPVPPTSAPHEVNDEVQRIEADFLLFESAFCNREGKEVSLQIPGGDQLRLSALEAEPPSEDFVALDPAFVRFSSGTTGQSKGVLLSHKAIHERTDAADRGLEITAADTILWVLSMSYHFVVSILLFLRRGATIRLCYDDFPLSLLESAKQGRGTFIYAAPFHYHAMASSKAFASESLKNVRMAVSTSMRLQEDTARAFADKFGFELSEAYGIIEVGLPFINHAPRATRGSVGRILSDYELKLQNQDRTGVGEILLRGRGMFSAYVSPWRIIREGEWFNTGDLGRIDDQGNLYIVGRRKSLINFMGMKIFPEEVEAVLDAHPCVAESLVFGQPHPRYGQLPCTRVVRCGEVEEDELVAHCLRELSPHKTPKLFEFVESLPKTPSGKLCRNLYSSERCLEEGMKI